MADAPLTRGALAPGTSKDIGVQWDGGWEEREGILLEPNVEERRRVLYGVPDKERISNVPDGLGKIFPISWARDKLPAGTSREENISIDDRALGVYPRMMFGAFGTL